MPSRPSPSSTRLNPRIRYYIYRRHGNAIVPLIPADQLPFRLKDFPRNLNHRELSEGGWKFLDETAEIPFPLALLSPCVEAPVEYQTEKDLSAAKAMMKGVSGGKATVKEGLAEETSTSRFVPIQASANDVLAKEAISNEQKAIPSIVHSRSAVCKTKSLTDSMAAIYTKDARRIGYSKPLPTAMRPRAAKEEEYCRHWLKTGECKHTKQGCWYKHEIPSLEVLKESGFIGLPGWIRNRSHSRPVTTKEIPGVSKKKPGEHALTEIYGVYTTNTADEPMLMDIQTTKSRPPPSQASVGTPSEAESTSTDSQSQLPVATPSNTSTNTSKTPIVHKPTSPNPAPQYHPKPPTDNPPRATAQTPKLSPTLIKDAVRPFDISASEPALNTAPTPISPPPRTTSPSPEHLTYAQPPTAAKEHQKPPVRPRAATKASARSRCSSAQAKKNTPGLKLRVHGEEIDKTAKSFAKHRVSLKKGCEIRVREPGRAVGEESGGGLDVASGDVTGAGVGVAM